MPPTGQPVQPTSLQPADELRRVRGGWTLLGGPTGRASGRGSCSVRDGEVLHRPSGRRRSRTRHLVPNPTVEKPPRLLLIGPAPLFEEERNPRVQTLVAQLGHPVLVHRSRVGTGLAADDGPVDAGAQEVVPRRWCQEPIRRWCQEPIRRWWCQEPIRGAHRRDRLRRTHPGHFVHAAKEEVGRKQSTGSGSTWDGACGGQDRCRNRPCRNSQDVILV